LAARNILVGEGETCKISDFGLSRETEENVYNVKTGGKIPVRWTPPEAIHYRKFSEKSDVWSFGVLLWEVMSYGSQPYAEWGNQQVLREVDKGYRLPCPQDCPDCIYYVMMKCWDKDDKSRPKFAEIKEELEDLYKNDFVGRSKPPRKREPVKGPLEYTSIKEWLEGLKMEQYIDNFMDAGLSLKECCDLSQDDLATIGIMVPGHQNKIMTSLNAHNKQNSVANGSAE
jgi:serine/threonine protein kinase